MPVTAARPRRIFTAFPFHPAIGRRTPVAHHQLSTMLAESQPLGAWAIADSAGCHAFDAVRTGSLQNTYRTRTPHRLQYLRQKHACAAYLRGFLRTFAAISRPPIEFLSFFPFFPLFREPKLLSVVQLPASVSFWFHLGIFSCAVASRYGPVA